MKSVFAALVFALAGASASAQQFASYDGFTTCPAAQTQEGQKAVEANCGRLAPPSFQGANFSTMSELQQGMSARDGFRQQVADYGVCVTEFINSYRRPGAPADSKAPDQAACAHAWAEDASTKLVRDFGKACNDFSRKTIMDTELEDYLGNDCYLGASGQG